MLGHVVAFGLERISEKFLIDWLILHHSIEFFFVSLPESAYGLVYALPCHAPATFYPVITRFTFVAP